MGFIKKTVFGKAVSKVVTQISDPDQGKLGSKILDIIDHSAALQAPVIEKYVNKQRKKHPNETPAQIIDQLTKIYIKTVTGSGAAVGAIAAIPAVGTVSAIAAEGGELIGFLNASAVYALAISYIHGQPINDRERRRALVLSVILGEVGKEAIQGAFTRKNNANKSPADVIGDLSPGSVNTLNQRLLRKFVVRFLAKRLPLAVGELAPAGIGAAIGAAGNRTLAGSVVKQAHDLFGPPPERWRAGLIYTPEDSV